MKFIDGHKQVASLTSTASAFTPGNAVANFRALAQAIADTFGKAEQVAVGDTICLRVEDTVNPALWEVADYTIGGTSATPTLQRGTIHASSAGAAAAVTFSGSVVLFSTVTASYLASLLTSANGVTLAGLTPAANGSLSGSTVFEVSNDGGATSLTATLTQIAAAVAVINGSSTADTTPPTFVSAQVATASPTVIQITMSEALGATLPAASAFSVSGSKTVSSVSIAGAVVSLTCSAPYATGDTITVIYTKPASGNMLQDVAANAAASFGPMSVTNNVAASGASYQVTPYGSDAVVSSVAASSGTTYSPKILIVNSHLFTDGYGYWNISPTPASDGTALAYAGFVPAGSAAPTRAAIITAAQNAAGSSSINGMIPMSHPGAYQYGGYLVVGVGTGTTSWDFYVMPQDGPAQKMGTITVTGA